MEVHIKKDRFYNSIDMIMFSGFELKKRLMNMQHILSHNEFGTVLDLDITKTKNRPHSAVLVIIWGETFFNSSISLNSIS